MSKGTVTLYDPLNTNNVREVEITDLVRSTYKGHRLCTVAETEEKGFVLAIENPKSSGRNEHAQMYLTEESMLSLMHCVFLFYKHKGIDITKRMNEVVNEDNRESKEYESL